MTRTKGVMGVEERGYRRRDGEVGMKEKLAVIRAVLLAALLFLVPAALHAAGPAADTTGTIAVIDDDEEYSVMSALLFPNEPEVPDDIAGDEARRAVYLAERRADTSLTGLGLGWGSFRIFELTTPAHLTREPQDLAEKAMIDDFNAKNIRRWKLEKEKLDGKLPEGKYIRLVREKDVPMIETDERGWELRKKSLVDHGLTRLSRVGFNRDKTRAIVEIDYQADPEMGVGYRVYLSKSQKSGKWLIDSAVRTRIY